MEYSILGNTGLKVSRICFGSLTIGPLQANLSIDEGSSLLFEAFEKGINFVDTAELYNNYSHIRLALKKTNKNIVVASRTYAYNKEMARLSLEKSRKELDRDVIDIFGLHEQESQYTINGHREALEYFVEAKQKGIIKAVLITTHYVNVVKIAANMPEIDVIHPIINLSGLGIADGTVEDMLEAIRLAHKNGKGIYSMKPFGGGNLIKNYTQCLDFVLNIPYIHSIAIGMKNISELNMNIKYFNGNKDITSEFKDNLQTKKLHIEFWCEKCGNCIKRCSEGALKLENNTVVVDKSKCLLCGYCSTVCPNFAIRIV